jgi:hypothetical protein
MGYTLHLQKVVKEKGKKTKVNNPCITSLKSDESYERGENIPPLFHPHSPSRQKRKEKLHILSPKYMVGQCSKCELSTHSLTYSLTLHLPSHQNTQGKKKPIPSPKLLDCPHIYKGFHGLLSKNFMNNL